jgi:hypothetical protein
MKRFLFAVALAFLTTSLSAQVTTNPIRYTWIATSCQNWNCAASALVLANGDKYVIVMPTGREDVPWIILKRVDEGSVFIPEDEPFSCEVFQETAAATATFDGMEACHSPMMLSVPDGRMVIASVTKCGTTTRRSRAEGAGYETERRLPAGRSAGFQPARSPECGRQDAGAPTPLGAPPTSLRVLSASRPGGARTGRRSRSA